MQPATTLKLGRRIEGGWLTVRTIKGQRILITGASSGIGEALARGLARQGARVALAARRMDRLKDIADELQAEGHFAFAAPMDVRDAHSVASGIAQAVKVLGGLDILINNAGIAYFGEVVRMSREALDAVIETNIYGVIYATKTAAPHLAAQHGMVVNVTSGLSKRALPLLTVYAGTKSMLNALSDGMRLELRRHQIHVLNYSAPETATGLSSHTLHEEDRSLPPIRRRLAEPERVANAIIGAIRRERRQVFAGAGLLWLALLMPRVVDHVFYRALVLRYGRDTL